MPIKAWFSLCNIKVDQFCAMIPVLSLLEIFNFQIFFTIYFNFSSFLLSLFDFFYFYLFLGSFILFQCYLKKPLVILDIQLVTFQVGLPSAFCFRKPNGVTTLLWQINSQGLCCRLIHLMWMRLTRISVTPLRKQPKRLSHAGIEITIFRVGMHSVNPSIKPFCSLLREMTQVWLLQLCLPSLTESRKIDGLKLFTL